MAKKKTLDRSQYYLGNANLPTVNAEFEYTPEIAAEIIKCTEDLLYFAEKYFYIINGDKGRILIPLHDYQKKALEMMRDNRFSLLLFSRQVGKTTISTIFCLWVACFKADQNILIVANKEATAKEILKKVKLAFEELPGWLKPGTVNYKEESVVLGNGSRISITTTTGSAGRGMAANILFVDEADWVDAGLLAEFWASVFPIISSMTTSKIIMASTPRDTSGLFYKLYSESADGLNAWKHMKIIWSDVPGRDEQWKKEIQSSLSDPTSFSREFECEFAESGESVLNLDLFERMQKRCVEAPYVYMDGAYRMWEQPKEDRIYTVGVDVAEGVGKDSTIIQVFDITDLRQIVQVAIYASNTITPIMFTSKLNEILKHWGSPHVLIERNGCGGTVADNLRKDFNYMNIVCYGQKEANRINTQLGVIAHTNTKYDSITNQRYWINTLDVVTIYDKHTLLELRHFVRKNNGAWGAGPGKHDDRVTSMNWALMILHDKLISRYFDVLSLDDNRKPLVIRPFAYEANHFTRPSKLYANENENQDVMPTIFGNSMRQDELTDMSMEGWQLLTFE